MKIKKIFQNKHKINIENDYILVQMIERDICLLYHQLSDYNYIMGDLYYNEIYSKPYWEYINIKFPEKEAFFIYEGCLVMILCMAWEIIDCSGTYLHRKIKKCIKEVNNFQHKHKKLIKLKKITLETLKFANLNDNERSEKDEELLFNSSLWVHENFVKEYFKNIVSEFENNSYFKKK